MTHFIDGPARGIMLSLSRGPMFLRVTECSDGVSKIYDALDAIDDQAEPYETIHVYIINSQDGAAFIDGRDKKTGKRYGRRVEINTYRVYPTQPPQAILHDNAQWQKWVNQEAEKLGLPEAGNEPKEK